MSPQSSIREQQHVTPPETIIAELETYLGMKDGWDSYGAPAPTPATVRRAMGLVVEHAKYFAPCSWEVAPALDGGVDLSLEHGARWLTVFVRNTGVTSVERSDDTGATCHSPNDLRDHLRWVTGDC